MAVTRSIIKLKNLLTQTKTYSGINVNKHDLEGIKADINKKLNETEELKFAIFHFADTGYFDSVDIPTKKDARKLKTNTFSNVKNSRSLLIFVAGKNYWAKDCHEWNNTWSFKDFIDKSFGIQTNEKGDVLVFKQYDLAKFYDESSTLFCMKDFENLCEQNSIPIKIQDSFIKKN